MNRLLLLMPLALAACAATPPPGTPLAADQISCDREVRVGSNLPTTRCRSAAQREAERRSVEAMGENLRPGAATRDAGS
ncbi:MAG TPA: hypothetical protein VGE36_00620 [Roseateles sp.]